jgi:hypothetical protein
MTGHAARGLGAARSLSIVCTDYAYNGATIKDNGMPSECGELFQQGGRIVTKGRNAILRSYMEAHSGRRK